MMLSPGRSAWRLAVLAGCAALVLAGGDLSWKDDNDMTRFVTRPEFKVPRLKVTHRADTGVSPGLWFLGPYIKINQQRFAKNYYQACSSGPTLYDNDGELVWSGACVVQNSNACDFRAFTDENGANHLSMIFAGHGGVNGDIPHMASIIDNTYNLATARNITTPVIEGGFNMHEFKVIDQGRSALYITYKAEYADIRDLNISWAKAGWVANVGFREVDLASGDVLFEWWSLRPGGVSPAESTVEVNEEALRGPPPTSWNWFHPNSIDKSPEGDYLISGRFVDAIYKISGKDGSILWHLGGKSPSFTAVDFNFSKQHDAVFMGRHPRTGEEVISLFDNAKALNVGGIDTPPTRPSSSGIVVALDTVKWTARLLRRIERPDGGLTALRGNFQLLPGGNWVGGWSDDGYFSEHAPDGRLLLEARFASARFVNYRTYKFNFTAVPGELPVLKAFVYGEDEESATTVWYVSWNGATEVGSWRFCRGDPGDRGGVEVVGQVEKKGFETMFQSDGVEGSVFVEAIARNGSVIGRSGVQEAELTWDWSTDTDSLKNADRATGPDSEWEKSEL